MPTPADPTSKSEFGRAWRTGISGQTGKTNVNVAYRDVSENFGNPANPSLTQASQPNLRGVDSAVTQTTAAGTFGLNYTFLANNVHPTTSDELFLHNFDETWSKQFGAKTNLVVDARQSLTQTGTVPASLQGQPPDQTGAQDQRDISGNINLSRQIGTVTMSAGATRDWNHNNYFPDGRHDHFVAESGHEPGNARVLSAELADQCELGCGRWADGGHHAQYHGLRAAGIRVEEAVAAGVSADHADQGADDSCYRRVDHRLVDWAVWRQSFMDAAGSVEIQHIFRAGQLQPEPRQHYESRSAQHAVAGSVDGYVGAQAHVLKRVGGSRI